eukprot:TRINITY_DN97057_c0_g1_i1.p1 TRINITY_DN97057_c0_g1~~TRINITY_DN97057_c0_g1_i1.p1  ORF type:complete len:321 (-),score=81.64 TRINITY_DN97057_c0_g1_i1:101-1063(-)
MSMALGSLPPQLDNQVLHAALQEAQEQARAHQTRAAELCAESRETATFCSLVSTRFDKQVELNGKLRKNLAESEAEVKNLRCELRELRRGEAERMAKVAAHEAAVRSWESERLKELPAWKQKVKDELVSEARRHHGRLEDHVQKRVTAADTLAQQQVHEMQAELVEARQDKADLGRKCCASYEATKRAELAAQHWQRCAQTSQQELREALAERMHLREEIHLQSARIAQHEQQASKLQAELKHSEATHVRHEEASQDMRNWVLQSLHEVNRSAHPQGVPRRGGGLMGARDERLAAGQWVSILESFRENHQTKSGYGNRSR